MHLFLVEFGMGIEFWWRSRNMNIIDSMVVGEKAEASTVRDDRFSEIPSTPSQGEFEYERGLEEQR